MNKELIGELVAAINYLMPRAHIYVTDGREMRKIEALRDRAIQACKGEQHEEDGHSGR